MKVRINGAKLTSVAELKEELKRVWTTETTRELCRSLVEFMPRRIAAVIKKKGYQTKY